MKNNKIKPQRKKEYGRGENKDKKKNLKKSTNEKVNIVDEKILFEKSANILEKESQIYLLNLKVGAIKDNKKVYAVIFKKNESVSHSHCIEATRVIQSVIKSAGFDEGDYTITVSSAGFRWKIEERFELFENMLIKIKYKINNEGEDKIITESGILKESKEDYIFFENEDKEKRKILKEDIIKTRLNC